MGLERDSSGAHHVSPKSVRLAAAQHVGQEGWCHRTWVAAWMWGSEHSEPQEGCSF